MKKINYYIKLIGREITARIKEKKYKPKES